MPSQLIKNDAVSFICARTFTYAGEQYVIGTDFPQEKATGRIEALVRTRYLIPVVESTDVKPRHWHREVRLRSIVLAKLGIEAGEDHPDDPEDEEIEEEVEVDDQTQAEAEESDEGVEDVDDATDTEDAAEEPEVVVEAPVKPQAKGKGKRNG